MMRSSSVGGVVAPGQAVDLKVRRTYRGYRGSDALAHVTAFSEDEAVGKLLEHVHSLTRVVVMEGMNETEVWSLSG
jgi:hypothetical protein